MKVGSLFSGGCAGLEMGVEMAVPNATVRWQCESDPRARTRLRRNFPEAAIYDDVHEVHGETVEPVDLICGGFPCQPHSVAGRRRGTTDERWLWPEFERIVEEVGPSIVFGENVPGLRTSGLREVLRGLARLGFDAEWTCVSAAHAGAPHRRRRLFVLAYRDREQLRAQLGWRGWPRWQEALFSAEPCPPWVAPDFNRPWRLQPGGGQQRQWRWSRDGNGWSFESPVPGVVHGRTDGVDRERFLGNACVPQQAALALQILAAQALEGTT